MTPPHLSRYSTLPLFNIKAVTRETGVSAGVLRAWERRYTILAPDRSANHYRLYSERDIALIHWLTGCTAEGWTISQAVEWYRQYGDNDSLSSREHFDSRFTSIPDVKALHTEFIKTFLAFDEQGIDTLLNRLFARYSLEEVLSDVLHPVLLTLGMLSRQGEVSKAVGYFASGYAKRKVTALLNAQPHPSDAPLVITGCAPHEKHDLDILLVSLFLRRTGWRLLYLGQNVPVIDLRTTLETLRPVMLVLSATLEQSALNLIPIDRLVADLPPGRPLFGFCGYAFEHQPDLVDHLTNGIYLGGATPQVVMRRAQHHLALYLSRRHP